MEPRIHGASPPRVFHGIRELLTMSGECAGTDGSLGIVRDAALVVDECGRVGWVGPLVDLPKEWKVAEHIDLRGAVVLPGIVDPHTHLVFAGDRADDFVARCNGATYTEIAARGGGILTTVRATREASVDTLVALGIERLNSMLSDGVTTVEVKTGYGLELATESKQLDAIEQLARRVPQRLVATLLCHRVPVEFAHDPDGFAKTVMDEWLPAAVGRARFVDVFVENGAWDVVRGSRILAEAKKLGFGIKAHTEQLSPTGFGAAAACLGAVSLEHLEHATDTVLDAMAANGTTAVLLPGASVFLGDAARPPVAAMRKRGIPMALGTDLNPGSSPVTNPWLIATLACTLYGLAPHEALLGLTRHAARAIGLSEVAGQLSASRPADFLVTHVPSWRHLLTGLGHHPVASTWIAGHEASRTVLDRAFG